MALTIEDVLIRMVGSTEDAQRAIGSVRREIERFPDSFSTELNVEIQKAKAELESVKQDLEEIDRSRYEPTIQAEVARAIAQVEVFKARLDSIPARKEVNLSTRGSMLRDLASVESGVVSLGRNLKRTQSSVSGFRTVMGHMFGALRSLGPLLLGTSIVITTALIPAFVALGASLASAAAGVGLLAAAFIAVLGPAVAVAIAVAQRFAKIVEAYTAAQDAKDAATRRGARADAEALRVESARAAAQDALTRALRGREAAEEALARAREDAARAITEAQKAEVDAAEALARSVAEVREQTVSAYGAIEDAAEAARDAVLDLRDAELDREQIKLDLGEARAQLRDFIRDMGATGVAFDSLFNRFTDVDFDTSDLRGALRRAGVSIEGDDQQRQLAQLILNVRKAVLAAKQADDAYDDSKKRLNETRKEEQRYQREGIRAYEPLTNAIDAQRQAEEDLADAQALTAQLLADGVEGADAVVAARRAMADATLSVNAAERQMSTAGLGAAATEADKAKEAYDRLTESEQRFLDALMTTGSYLSGFFQPITDAIFVGLTRGLEKLPGLMGPLEDGFNRLGDSIVKAFDGFGAIFDNERVTNNLRRIVDLSGEFVEVLGGDILPAFVRLFLEFATVVGPKLIEVMREFSGYITGLANGAENLSNINTFVNNAVESFRVWARLIGGILNVWKALVEVVAPFGDELVVWLTDALNAFAEWMRSAEGSDRIAQFFRTVIPLIQSIAGKLLRLGIIFFEVFEAVAPFLQGFIDGMNSMLDVVIWLLEAWNSFASSPFIKAIEYAIGQFLAFGGIGRTIGIVFRLLRRLPAALVLIGNATSRMLRPFMQIGGWVLARLRDLIGVLLRLGGRVIGAVWRGIRGGVERIARVAGLVVATLVGVITGAFERIVGVGRSVIRWLVDGIRARFALLLEIGTWVLARVIEGVRSVGHRLLGAGEWIVTTLVNAIRGVKGWFVDLGKDMLLGLLDGLTAVGQWVFDAIGGLVDKIVGAVKDFLGIHSPSRVFYDIGRYMLEGLIKGFTSGDVVGFIQRHLGGLSDLGLKLGGIGVIDLAKTGLDPVSLGLKLGGDFGGALGDLAGLARGGLVRGTSIRTLGEGPYDEAVLPLSERVLGSLARSIAERMTMPSPSLAGVPQSLASALGQAGGRTYHQEFIIPPAPAGDMPDPRYVAVQIAQEQRRRGG